MLRNRLLAGFALAFLAAASARLIADRAPDQATAPAPVAAAVDSQAVVQKYCVSCHNDRTKTGGVSFQSASAAEPWNHADVFERALVKLRGGMMPPPGMPRPDQPVLDALITALENTIDAHALKNPDPGHKPVHRLNRTEYGNAVRDLLDLRIDVTDLLPADDESDGFDNIAGVLRVSPSLLEQYLAAARKISGLAVGTDHDLVRLAFRIPPDDSQTDHVDGLPLGTRGGLVFDHHFPQDAEYEFAVFLVRNIVGYMTGLEFAHQLEITIDGESVFSKQVGGEEDLLASDKNMSEAGNMIDRRLKTRVKVTAGPHKVGVTFARRNAAESDEPLQLHERHHDLQDMNGLPLIDYVNLTGPFDPTGPGDTPSRRRVFSCKPGDRRGGPSGPPVDEAACAKTILTTLARRAYRRPVTDEDMAPIMSLYDAGRKKGNFESGIEQGLRLILASPKFLFRTETVPARGATARVTDLELASRLSFFLWSSIPDDTLLNLAAQGRLGQPAVLEQQVRRMLADPKARALVDNFASQWLMLRNLKGHQPVPGDFPNWDNELRQSLRAETQLFFESIMREDRSVLDLINADYTYVNERLARHYGIPNVYGSHFRRVTLRDEARRGLLGQGSILTVTSYPNRTSPVLRGKYILENILGTPPSPPPPNVDTTLEQKQGEEPKSMRALLERHRANPTCAACHRVMDPLGFALENFDGVGEFRKKEVAGAIDSTGQLGDGTPIDGPAALRRAILKRPEMFVRTLTQKLMTYGLGRAVEAHDKPLVRAIARDVATQNYRFSAVVLGIVKSAPFQMKKAHAEGAEMIITKKHIPRRTFLRGMGVTLALPLLDSMVPARTLLAQSAANVAPRLGFIYIPHGAVMDKWTPATTGSGFEFTPILKPLEPFRDYVNVVSGLGHRAADTTAVHSLSPTTWLSGVRPKATQGVDAYAGVTADQVAAQSIGQDTILPSMEIATEDHSGLIGSCDRDYGCIYMNTLSWRTPETPLPMEINPRKVFERMFGQGGSAAERLARIREDRSILDAITRDVNALQLNLGPSDRQTMNQYLENIREIERRIERAEKSQGDQEILLPTRPAGVPFDFEEHVRLMYDLMVLAYQANISRVVTFMVSREVSNRTYPQVGVSDGHHAISHHQNRAEKMEKNVRIQTFNVGMFAEFIQKMKNTPDGDGSLLDHSVLLYGSNMSNSNAHDHFPLPNLVLGHGGGLKGDRHLRYPDHTPMTNLLISMLSKVGVRQESLGDSTGVFTDL